MVVQGVGRAALSSAKSVDLIGSTRRGRLITTLGALPAAEPVPFVADGRQVVVRVVEPSSIREGDVLSLQVDDIDARTGSGWSVLVTGSARRIARGDRLVEKLCARATEDWLDESGQLVLLADPLIRGMAINPMAAATQIGPSRPDRATEALHVAVALAVRAPSVHNTQPWRWEVTGAGLDLHVDPTRRLPVLDPDGRAQLISCGASLQHARTALVAAGWGVQTLTFPEPDDPDLLARLRLLGRVPPEDRDLRLADAATHRRTDRRPFGSRRVPAEMLAELVAAARFEDAVLYPVEEGPQWSQVVSLIDEATQMQAADPAYRDEIARWTGPAAPEGLGVPAASVTGPPGMRTPAVRDFGEFVLNMRIDHPLVEHPTLAVLCTNGDDRRAWLRAGEATARVLLVAEVHGFAVSPLTPPLEIAETRVKLRGLLPGVGEPQMVFRIGCPAAGERPPLTPRAAV